MRLNRNEPLDPLMIGFGGSDFFGYFVLHEIMGGDRVILGTKIKCLQRERYWKEMPILGNVALAVLRLSDEIDF